MKVILSLQRSILDRQLQAVEIGLQSAASGLQMNPVPCTQVSTHVYCPTEPDTMTRLQNSTYFKLVQFPGIPDQFMSDLQATILPPLLPSVVDILADIAACDNHQSPPVAKPDSSTSVHSTFTGTFTGI